jgi:hypothetical protein
MLNLYYVYLSGERPLSCRYCGKGFIERRYLERHLHTKHLGTKPLICHLCTYTCVKRDTLKRHIQASHGTDALPSDMCAVKKKRIRVGIVWSMTDMKKSFIWVVFGPPPRGNDQTMTNFDGWLDLNPQKCIPNIKTIPLKLWSGLWRIWKPNSFRHRTGPKRKYTRLRPGIQ